MDSIDYYDKYAGAYYQDTVNNSMEDILEKFVEYLPEDASVLDLGCGSGRDSLYLIENGYSVTAIDGSKEMCELAEIHTGQDVLNMEFDELDFEDVFEGVWACASLLHVEPKDMINILSKIYTSLKDNGILYMSFKYGDFQGFRKGRYFVDYTTKSMRELLRNQDYFEIMDIWKSEDNRDNQDQIWLNVFLKKKNED